METTLTPKPGSTAGAAWRGRRVVVVGMARSGRAVARLLAAHGAVVRGTDLRREEELDLDRGALEGMGIELRLGGHRPGDLEGAELAVVSPGIPKSAAVLGDARARGLPLLSELEVASRFARAPVAAVTGTNGKSTTVTVLGSLIRSLGRPVAVAGNVGRALSDVVEGVPGSGFLVVEVSSFQLEDVDRFHPRTAAVLNLSPDHLDRYRDFGHYVETKLRIFSRFEAPDTAVIPAGEPRLEAAAASLPGRVLRFGGAEVAEGIAWTDDRLVRRSGGAEAPIVALDRIPLPGPHNRANLAAALCLLEGLGLDAADRRVAAAIPGLRGLPHRLERVGEVQGVVFYNDSKATNPDSLRVALSSFPEPVVLIAGGRAKKGGYRELAPVVRKHAARIVLLGEGADLLAEAWRETGVVSDRAGTSLERAVTLAFRAARDRGLAVVFSPGCASFDMFRDFEDRGDGFRALVAELEGAS